MHPLGLPFTYQTIGVVLFGTYAVLVSALAAYYRTLALPAAALSLGLFMLLTQMHERYMFPALAFVLLAGTTRPRLWIAYAVLSATLLFNLVTIAPFSPALGTNLVAARADSMRVLFLKWLSLLAAAMNTVMLVWIVVELVYVRLVAAGDWIAGRMPFRGMRERTRREPNMKAYD